MTRTGDWAKSSHSANTSNCVEADRNLRRIRDSKNPTGPTLDCDVAALARFLRTH